ncbi:hypothetical protein I4U23_023175 [Adineta vaga]|nr:hypothetical protein I4U23_023175 [Adineta vaga]
MNKNLLDENIQERLRNELQATDEELTALEKLIEIQRSKMNLPHEDPSQPSIVIDNFLYHGDLGHAIDMDLLLELKIQHIINVCDCPLDKNICEVFDVIWIEDLEDNFQGELNKHLDRTNDLLCKYKEKNEKVLVHCQAGISRSSSIVLAYLIKYHNDSLEQAYKYLLEKRPIVAPNYSFLIQLIRYEKEIRRNEQNPIKTIDESDLKQKSSF